MNSCNSVIKSSSQCLWQLIQILLYVQSKKRTCILYSRLNNLLEILKTMLKSDSKHRTEWLVFICIYFLHRDPYLDRIIWYLKFNVSSKKNISACSPIKSTVEKLLLNSKCWCRYKYLILRVELHPLTWDFSEAPSNIAKCVTILTRVKGVRDIFLVSRASGLFLSSGSPRMWPGFVWSLKKHQSVNQSISNTGELFKCKSTWHLILQL